MQRDAWPVSSDTIDPPRAHQLERELLKAEEVAAILGVGRTKVFSMIASGELPLIRIGRLVRVPRDALAQWVADHTTAPQCNHVA